MVLGDNELDIVVSWRLEDRQSKQAYRVAAGEGVDVEECEGSLGFEELVARDFALDDFTEEAGS